MNDYFFKIHWLAFALLIKLFAFCANAQAQEQVFDINEYVIEGNTTLDVIRIEEAVYPFLGPKKTIADAEGAREALEKAYQAVGYLTISVDIPEQRVGNGVIRLQVLEGKVDRLAVKGGLYFAASEIRRAVPELASGAVPNSNQVQAEVGALNKNPNRRVTPALKPGKTPGTVDVELSVDDNLPVSGALALSNFKNATGSALRLNADVRFENVGSNYFDNGHTLGLSLFTTPQKVKETQVWTVNYLIPTTNSGTFMAYAVRSDSASIEPVGSTLVQGKLRVLGLRYFFGLTERGSNRWNFSVGLDRKSNEQLVATPDGQGPIVYYPVTGTMNLAMGSAADQWKLDTTLIVGSGNGQRAEQEFAKRRLGASPNFSVMKIELANDRALSDKLRLRSRLGFHLSSAPLLNLEQASAGGYESVRGYYEAEQLGDRSAKASLELAYTFSSAQGFVRRTELLGFWEAAKLSVISPAVAQIDRFTLASVGLGARLKLASTVNLISELARPNKTTPQTRQGQWRFLTKLTYEY
jgi:hemolysin activation/secretion protein